MPHPLVEAVLPAAEAVGATIVPPEQIEAGDVPLEWDGEVVAGFRPSPLHGALERLIAQVERELGGASLKELDREQKQQAVRILDERGAFTLRKAVEEVADALGVSRFTVYNYLSAAPPAG